MDFITHLPVTKNGNDAIFSIVDRFSRFCVFIPIKGTIDAKETSELFFKYWVC
jgi:hypothetical protein